MRKNTDADILSAKFLRRFAASAAVLLAVCLVLMTPVSAYIPPDTSWYTNSGENDGSMSKPYIIADEGDLSGLAKLVNYGDGQQPQPVDFTGKYIRLDADLNLQNEPWEPIGGEFILQYPKGGSQSIKVIFNGTFIGNGKTISDLNVTIQESSSPNANPSSIYAGLFGIIGPGGSVSGLTVDGKVDVTGDGTYVFAGGIAGMSEGQISDSAFLGTVTAKGSEAYAGGIAGYQSGSGASATIEGCYSTGDITAESAESAYAGGIVGYLVGGGASATIEGCYTTGDVKINVLPLTTQSISGVNRPSFNAGGIAGYQVGGSASATIENCYTTGDVTVDGEYADIIMVCIGGIAGTNYVDNAPAAIKNCYTTGEIEISVSLMAGGTAPSNNPLCAAGGIVGLNQDDVRYAKVENCYALNKEISVPEYSPLAARVAGVSVDGQSILQLTNNYGWQHMVVSPDPATVIPSDSRVQGDDCCAVDILSASGWDFTDVWNIPSSGNYKLPVLKAFTTHPQNTPNHLLVTVTFEANGGSTVEGQTVLDGAMVTEPTGVTKTGYTLDGWFDQGLTNQWVFSTVVHPATMTLYAKWTGTTPVTPQQYTVNFYRNDGSNNEPYHSETVDNGVPVTRPATDPLRDNYAFTGWFTEAQGGTEYDFNTQVTADLNLYANWTISSGSGIAPGGGEPDDEPANNNNGGGGGGGEGTYDTYPRNTDENGDAGFGKSPVVIRVDLPEGTETAVTLITNPETPDTEDTDVYYEFELDIPDYPEETEGDVIWRIPKSLLNDEFGADDYGVYVYDEDEWKPLDSVWEEGDKDYIHYTTGISGDGNFIIVKEKGISKKAGDDAPVVTPGDEPQDEPGSDVPPSSGGNISDDKEEKEIPVLGIGIGVLILILIIAGIVIAVRRRK